MRNTYEAHSAVSRLLWFAYLCLFCGCFLGCNADSQSQLVLDSVKPNQLSRSEETRVVLHGSGFNYLVQLNLNQSQAKVRRAYRVLLGNVDIPPDRIRHMDQTRISVVLPKQLSVGWHSIEVISPAGDRARLEQGVQVLAPQSIGTGGSKAIPDADHADDDSGTHDAGADSGTARDPADSATDPADSGLQETQDSGEVSAPDGGVRDATPADVEPDATMPQPDAAAEAEDASASMDDAASSSHVLHLETAPDGSGLTLTDRSISTDESLQLFAVERDAIGRFVSNVEVSFSQTSPIGLLAPTVGTQTRYSPNSPGGVHVIATHPTLGDAQTGLITVTAGQAVSLQIHPSSVTLWETDAPVMFSASGLDADGNQTDSVGVLSWRINSGFLPGFDPETGLLTPTEEGVGTIAVESSLGPIAQTGQVQVLVGGVSISQIDSPTEASLGETFLLDVAVTNSTNHDAWFTGDWLEFSRLGTRDISSFEVFADDANPKSIAAGDTARLRYWVEVTSSSALGSVDLIAHLQTYFQGLRSSATAISSTTLEIVNELAPEALISGPVPPGNLACVDEPIDFVGNSSSGPSPLSYSWDLPGASIASASTANALDVSYPALGPHAFSLRVTDALGRSDRARRGTMFVGEALPGPQSYPTGPILFGLDDEVSLHDLPSPIIESSHEVRRCDGVKVTPGNNDYVTLWVDRGRLDPSQDVLPLVPGVQVRLNRNSDEFDGVWLLNASPQREGPALIYAEYHEPSTGLVTAAGSQLFSLKDDQEPPNLVFSYPGADCGLACWGQQEPLTFGFSEPMSSDLLTEVSVTGSISTCEEPSAVPYDLTEQSLFTFDAEAWTLQVWPPEHAGSSTTVTLGGGIVDLSSNQNSFLETTHCIDLLTREAAPAPVAPTDIAQSAFPFSPDGDSANDILTITAAVDEHTHLVRLDVYDGDLRVRRIVRPVIGAGLARLDWDGRDLSGRVVRDGYFRFELTAMNANGQLSNAHPGVLQVDSAVHFSSVFTPK